MPYARVFLIVLDSVGAGAAPDASCFGDEGAFTLKSVSRSPALSIPTLQSMGLGNVEGLSFLSAASAPVAAYGRMREMSAGKDTTIGHWELAGHVSHTPLPTYPEGFPRDLLEKIENETGTEFLCNRPASGTQVIADYGEEHLRTRKPILYTSADSVFQIAAHTDVMSEEELWEICRKVRPLLTGAHGVGRVIARPFAGTAPHFYRTEGRRDFSLEPPDGLLPQRLCEKGFDVISIGKISDIFAAKQFTRSLPSHNNEEGMHLLEEMLATDFHGLCFVNLVDFDMLYGHRRDIDGYAAALSAFDCRLQAILPRLRKEDLLIITADHGCDPAYTSTTDHTREYVPVLLYGDAVAPRPLGTRESFTDVAATVYDALGICRGATVGKSML